MNRFKRFLLRRFFSQRERLVIADGLHYYVGAKIAQANLPANRTLKSEIEDDMVFAGELHTTLFPAK